MTMSSVPSTIAIVTPHPPAWATTGTPGILWCATPAEVTVLARHGRLRAAIVDVLVARLDPGLLLAVRRSCPVLVVDGRPGSERWEALGAVVVGRAPTSAADACATVEDLERAPRGEPAPIRRPDRSGALAVVLAAPGGSATPTSVAVAGSLAATAGTDRTVVLADLSRRAPHRILHGIGSERAGLPDLLDASRFGPPPPASITRALHVVDRRYLVVPGLEHPHDWVLADHASTASAIGGLLAAVDVVVAQVDPDLEGEVDTGSFDIEDRNALARTAVRRADLVLVAAGSDRYGRLGAVTTLASLARHGIPHERTVVLLATGRPLGRRLRGRSFATGQVLAVRGDRVDRALGAALLGRIADVGPRVAATIPDGGTLHPVRPGELGHWRQDIDGWITPRAPQQP